MKKIVVDTKKSRGRPARLDRARGAAVAAHLFHQEGYDQIGVASLCDALGVRQPALYRVFKNKAGLFDAALELYGQSPFASFLSDEAECAKSSNDLMRRILMRATEVYTADPSRLGCMALEVAFNSKDQDAQRSASVMVENTRAFLIEQFASFGSENSTALADAVLITMRGLSSAARAGQDTATLKDAVDALLSNIDR